MSESENRWFQYCTWGYLIIMCVICWQVSGLGTALIVFAAVGGSVLLGNWLGARVADREDRRYQ